MNREGASVNRKTIIIASISWVISFLLVLPGLYIGYSYEYSLNDWLSLVTYPDNEEENGLWFFRILIFCTLLVTTCILIIGALRNLRSKTDHRRQ